MSERSRTVYSLCYMKNGTFVFSIHSILYILNKPVFDFKILSNQFIQSHIPLVQ